MPCYLSSSALLAAFAFSNLLHAQPLRTVAWNIEWFPGVHREASKGEQHKHLKATQPELNRIDPDILLAQEITDQRAFEKLISAVPGLKLNVISKFAGDKERRPPYQQQAIASKLEAHSAWFEDFKPAENLPDLRRGFAFAALKHPAGGLIMVYSVHLKSNGGSDTHEGELNVANTRRESIKQILAHKLEMEKKFAREKIVGWIVGGDFNTNNDNQFKLCTAINDMVRGGFHNTWEGVAKSDRLTWRINPDPARRRFEATTFDYIFTISFKPARAQMFDVPRALSDHFPIGVFLEKE